MVLLIDTSGTKGQLLIAADGRAIGERQWQKEGSHSEKLTVELLALFKQVDLAIADLTSIAVVVGPGSFTGLRVGINCAKALAYSLNIPVIPVNTLWAIACELFPSSTPIISMVDAQRNSIFVSEFTPQGVAVKENAMIKIEDFVINDNYQVCGWGFTRYQDYFNSHRRSHIIKFTHEWPRLTKVLSHLDQLVAHPWSEIQPVYLRKSAAEEKLN